MLPDQLPGVGGAAHLADTVIISLYAMQARGSAGRLVAKAAKEVCTRSAKGLKPPVDSLCVYVTDKMSLLQPAVLSG